MGDKRDVHRVDRRQRQMCIGGRDKDDLRQLGVPLEVERTESVDGPVDGYRVSQSDYYLHDLGLAPDEVVALSVALRLIRLEGA